MPFLLRGNINTKFWSDAQAKQNLPWLPSGEIIADPILDFKISVGELSLWHIEDDQSNLDRVIAALAATRNHFDHYAYHLIDLTVLEDEGFEPKKTDGETPDNGVNQWHFDIIELTPKKVADLTLTFFHKGVIREKFKGEVKELIDKHKHLFVQKKLNKSMKQLLGL